VRKGLVVLVVAALLVVVVFGVGIGAGGGGAEGSAGWRDRLGGIRAGEPLGPEDLTFGDGCTVTEEGLTFSAGCVVQVAERDEGLSLAPPVRDGSLTHVAGIVRLTLVLQGKEISRTMDAGRTVRITFGPEGGTLGLQCLGLTACAVALS
jgi:hypothetical protein